MLKPPIPKDEALRIKNLHDLAILDTPPEARFDQITQEAKTYFGVPIAVISLVDTNRQWFKSCTGLDVCETSRDVSFCGHTILTYSPLVVEDALQDERFADNPLVTGEPFIRFYAGFPLVYPDKTKLGTLCIIDTKPRVFTENEVDKLVDLAKRAQAELLVTLRALTP